MASPLDGHEFKEAPGVGDGLGRLACCSPWGRKELDMPEQLKGTEGQGVVLGEGPLQGLCQP